MFQILNPICDFLRDQVRVHLNFLDFTAKYFTPKINQNKNIKVCNSKNNSYCINQSVLQISFKLSFIFLIKSGGIKKMSI